MDEEVELAFAFEGGASDDGTNDGANERQKS